MLQDREGIGSINLQLERKMIVNSRVKMMMTIGLGILAGYMIGNKENRAKIKDQVEDLLYKMKQPFANTKEDTLSYAGLHDQTDLHDEAQIENTKMVSEGSQYGIHYYNELQEKQSEDA